jgi:hypothetical protein
MMLNVPFDSMGHLNSVLDDNALTHLARTRCSECDGYIPIAVEVGSWAGRSTRIIEDSGFMTFAVDHWRGSTDDRIGDLSDMIGAEQCFRTFCKNMGENLLSTVFPLRGSSELIASLWPRDKPIDLCFIDADHDYKFVLQDIQLWTPLIRTGGLLIGHDFSEGFGGVIQAVKETGPYELMGQAIWYRRIEW